jgi:hypothetical protein
MNTRESPPPVAAGEAGGKGIAQGDFRTITIEYVRHGLALVPLARGKKGPHGRGWQHEESAIRDEERAARLEGCNVGLAHRWSGTCAIDVDDYPQAEAWLADRGIDLRALLAADDAVNRPDFSGDRCG